MVVKREDVISSFSGLTPEEKAFMEKNADIICGIVNKATAGLMDSKAVEKAMAPLIEKADKLGTENVTLKSDLEKLQDVVKGLTETLEKAKQRGVSPLTANKFLERFDEMMDSQKLKNFIDGVEKASGWFSGFKLKEISGISSVENNYEGEALLTRQSPVVANPYMGPNWSVRDIIRTIPGDPQHPSFTYLRVKEFDRNVNYETENGRLKRSDLSFEEVSTSIRRCGSYFDLSKNLLMARVQLRAFLIAQIPGMMVQAENASVLYGDGQKSHLLGICNIPGVTSIESQITDAIVTGAAGDVESVSKHADGKNCLVRFKSAISKALDSQMVTFTGAAVNTDLNSAHPIIKVNDHEVIVVGAAYKGAETALATMTYAINHASFKNIEAPNSRDVIGAIFACLSFAQYTPNMVCLNPLTVFAIESEKDSLGRPLDIIKTDANGRKNINGIPLVVTSNVPVGRYIAGDFANGANLYDYTNLEMQWVEDAETILYNMVRLVFQEQLALVVYMPWAFAEGSLEELKKSITKAAPSRTTKTADKASDR